MFRSGDRLRPTQITRFLIFLSPSRLHSPARFGSNLDVILHNVVMLQLSGLAIGSDRIKTAMLLISLSPPSISQV